MTKLKDLEAAYRQQAEGERVLPPAELWSRIEASLNAAQPAQKRVLPLWWRWAGSAAAVAALVVLLFWLPKNEDEAQLARQATVPSPNTAEKHSVLSPSPEETISGSSQEPGEQSRLETTSQPPTRPTVAAATDITNTNTASTQVWQPTSSGLQSTERLRPLAYQPNLPRFASTPVANRALKTKPDETFSRFDVPASNAFLVAHHQEVKQQKHSIRLGVAATPLYSYRETSSAAPRPAMMASSDKAVYNEKGLISASGGLHVSVDLGKRWAVETGLAYARMGQEVETPVTQSRLYASNDEGSASSASSSFRSLSLENSMGDIRMGNKLPENRQNAPAYAEKQTYLYGLTQEVTTTNAALQQHLDYLEVPLTLRYHLIDRQTRLSLSAGISTNWLVGNTAWLIEDGQRQKLGETEGIASMTFSTHAGLALAVPLLGPVSLRLEPRVSYFLSEINHNHPVGYKPWSMGFYSGIQYTFGE